jgi:4-hydroxy-tetrahydrodipicolinate synthase
VNEELTSFSFLYVITILPSKQDKQPGGKTMPLDHSAKGVFPIAPTPFDVDGRIDMASIDRLVDFYIACGSTGMTVLGVMGEAPKLEGAEALEVATRFIRRAGTLPVIVGVSAPGFAAMRSLALASMDAGAAGVMIAPPNTLRTDDQITTYYRQAVEAIGEDIPFVVQDYPLNFNVVMTPGVLSRIISENPSCVMLKHEDWPGLEKISTLRNWQAEGTLRPVSILCGNGGLFLDFEVERGADGAMTGYAFPDMLVDVVRLGSSGQRDAAHDLFDAHLPLVRYEQQPNIGLAVRKYVMARRGIITSDAQRKPGAALSGKARAEVEYLLSRVARFDLRAANLAA